MSARELRTVLRQHEALLPKGADPAGALRQLPVGAGVLIPAGDDRAGADPPYLWIHRTIAEYLVAEHLTTVEARERQQAIDKHLWFDVDWAPVWPMLGGLLPTEELFLFLDYLLEQQPDPVHHALMTAARVIGELDPDSASDIQPHIDKTARRLMALLQTPARGQIIDGLAHILPLVSVGIRVDIREALTQHPDNLTVWALARRPGAVATEVLATLASETDDLYRPSEFTVDFDFEVAGVPIGVGSNAAQALANRPGPEVTETLAILARHANAEVRKRAARVLADRPEPEATQALLTLASDTDPRVRAKAAQSLTDRSEPEVTRALLTLASDPWTSVRRKATEALRGRSGPEVTQALFTLASDTDSLVRDEAVATLTRRSDPEVFDALLVLAHDADSHAVSAATGLARRRSEPRVFDALLALAHDPSAHVRAEVAASLSWCSEPALFDALVRLAGDADREVRYQAAFAFYKRPEPEATTALVTLATDYDALVRSSAASGLKGRPEREVTQALLTLTRDPVSWVRKGVVRALADRRGREVTQALLTLACDDADTEVRAKATRTLSGTSEPDVTEALLTLASDPESWVRSEAARALADRPGPEVTQALLTLATGTGSTAWVAAKALKDQPGRDIAERDITEILIKLVSDPYEFVGDRAAEALAARRDSAITEWLLQCSTGTSSIPSHDRLYKMAIAGAQFSFLGARRARKARRINWPLHAHCHDTTDGPIGPAMSPSMTS